MRLLSVLHRVVAALGIIALCAIGHAARDTRPVVGPGATKEDVINAYGWPNGQSQSGTKEILNYSQGDVTLENGRVERVNFSPDVPWQTPRPRPGTPSGTTRKAPDSSTNYWLSKFSDAQLEAERRNARILVLFTGSDWSPASREFQEQVEFNPDFINAFAGDFVFLKLDYPRGSPVPAKISEENLRLRDTYEVTTYPALLVLGSNGGLLARVDLQNPKAQGSFRERVIAAVKDARDATSSSVPVVEPQRPAPPIAPAPKPTASEAPAISTPPAPAAAAPVSTESTSSAVESSTAPVVMGESHATQAVWTAGRLVVVGLLTGIVVVGLAWIFLWRQPKGRKGDTAQIAQRIDAAAGGLPSVADMTAWSKDKLCAIIGGLAEFDSYAAHIRPGGGDVDIELRKRGDVAPRVLVSCAPGSEGVVAAKRLRELFGSLAAEGAEKGWFVSPAGFSAEARDYAAAHRIVLVGCETIHNMMREVPPVSLPVLLARE